MDIDARLKELGLDLPEAPSPKGNYVPAVRTGNLLYLSGTLPLRDGAVVYQGAVGDERSIEDGYEAAKLCALNALAVAKKELGTLEAIEQIVLVNGFVFGVPGFDQSPQVINGASDLLGNVFGEKGKHARAAVTAAGLPLKASVEIQVVMQVGA